MRFLCCYCVPGSRMQLVVEKKINFDFTSELCTNDNSTALTDSFWAPNPSDPPARPSLQHMKHIVFLILKSFINLRVKFNVISDHSTPGQSRTSRPLQPEVLTCYTSYYLIAFLTHA